MLSREDNEILCRVGAGTPMGNLLRQYWLPAFISSELQVDGWPRRIRLLGEDLIAFRDTQGRVGVVDENCAHRGSSMIFARNEEGGVRCAYHGWKFDYTGACVDMSSEGEQSSFREKVKIKAYKTQERSGVVWLYMGPRQKNPPQLPNVSAWQRPLSEGEPFKYVRQCNWAQALEGDIDTVHINFLHSRLRGAASPRANVLFDSDSTPHLEIINTDYGFFYAGRRDAGDRYYWRCTQFVMPFYTSRGGKVWMPVDDYNTLIMEWSPSRASGVPRDYDEIANMGNARQPYGYKPDNLMIPWGNWRLKADVDNEWLRDRSLEKSQLFLGILSNPLQDSAVQVTMGAIYDRTREYLGTTDKAIIAFRRIMIQAAKALRDRGEVPPTVDDPSLSRVRGVDFVIPKEMNWIEASAPWRDYSEELPVEYQVPGERVRRPIATAPIAGT